MINLLSGGALGADYRFAYCATKIKNIRNVIMSFEGHTIPRVYDGPISAEAYLINKGINDFKGKYHDMAKSFIHKAAKNLHKQYPTKPYVLNLMARSFGIALNCNVLYAVGYLDNDGLVSGGTGWTIEFAKMLNKPVFFFDQNKVTWSILNGNMPFGSILDISESYDKFNIGCSGTRRLTDSGTVGIMKLFINRYAKIVVMN